MGWDLPRLPSGGRLQERNKHTFLPATWGCEVRLCSMVERKKRLRWWARGRQAARREGRREATGRMTTKLSAVWSFGMLQLDYFYCPHLVDRWLAAWPAIYSPGKWRKKNQKTDLFWSSSYKIYYLQDGPAAGSVRTQPEVPAMWSVASPTVVFALCGVLPWNAWPLASTRTNPLERPRLLESERP